MSDATSRIGRPRAEDGDTAGRTRLDLLKALGDNTRYAIYLELARSSRPLATADIAETLGLHSNTVRPHLERMREAGLLEVRAEPRGGVGRPQHLYSLTPDSPSLGLEPPAYLFLAQMLLRLAHDNALGDDAAVDAGREQGERRARQFPPGSSCVEALMSDLDVLGFDPEIVVDRAQTTIAFANCPYRDLAETSPAVVCGLHRGMVEGFVARLGGPDVAEFHTITDRHPCRLQLGEVPVDGSNVSTRRKLSRGASIVSGRSSVEESP